MTINNREFNFYPDITRKALKLIDETTAFSAVGLPAFGISIFLLKLSTNPKYKFIFVDAYELASMTKKDFFRQLLKKLTGKYINKPDEYVIAQCREELEKLLLDSNQKIVIIFNRFDMLSDNFDKNFFDSLRVIHSVNKHRIVFIFGVCRLIHNLTPESILGTNMDFFTNILYLRLYQENELLYLLDKYGPSKDNIKNSKKFIKYSGGHFQLLQLLLKTETPNNPIKDPFVNLVLKNIFSYLNHEQKKIVEKVALEKPLQIEDDYLLKTNLVRQRNKKYQLFSSLMADYIKTNIKVKFTAKENKLIKLLKMNLGKVVSRETIFNTVWSGETDNATDWALDSLAYRLRKNPAFTSQGYHLESYKKQGYLLIKN